MPLTPEEQAKYRRRLREEEQRLVEQFGFEQAEFADTIESALNPEDAPDAADAEGTKALLLNLQDREMRELRQVHAAQSRLEEGSYGICMNCGRDIERERLDAVPYTEYCITCARDLGRGPSRQEAVEP